MSFCKKCGTKLIKTPKWTGRFDGETGEKTYYLYVTCPQDKFFSLGHTGGYRTIWTETISVLMFNGEPGPKKEFKESELTTIENV